MRSARAWLTGLPGDVLLAAGLWLIFSLEAAFAEVGDGPLVLNMLLGVGIFAPMVWRRRAPLAATAVGFAFATLTTATLTDIGQSLGGFAILLVYTYAIGAYAEGRRLWYGAALVLAVVVAVDIAQHTLSSSDIVFPTVIGWLFLAAGRAVRNRAELGRALAEDAQALERHREEEEAAAAAVERARIARELHDVVAHTLSVMVIQAGAARRTLDRDPDRALAALETVEGTGRAALAELRRLLGFLDRSGSQPDLAPQPGLDELRAVAERARAAGLPVELRVEGEQRPLPAGVDLTAYRIVQEALTNALKHAGEARARVEVRYGPDAVELCISDTGRGPPDEADGGHGLVGMRERVAMHGGSLHAGRRRGGGFEVRATLPLARENVPTHPTPA